MAVAGLSGTVKSWNGAKGFGFITGSSLPQDILFGRTELPGDIREVQGKFMEGRPVVFDAVQGPDGRYKATAVAVPLIEGKEVAGKIKTFSEKHGYGFITSSSLTEDVRFQTTDLPQGVTPGAHLREELVTFEVLALPDGKLRVSSLRFQSKKIAMRVGGMGMGGGMGGMAQPGGNMGMVNLQTVQAAQAAQAQGLMTGTVKSFSEKNGYGFLNVAGYPMDIKFGRNELAGGNVSTGESVSFSAVQTPDGRITASNVSSLGGGMKRPASAMGGMGMMGMGAVQKVAVTETPTGRSAYGMIKTYNGQKGFGFISSPGVPGDVFFMMSSLPAEVKSLHGKELQGKNVNFQVSQTSDGKTRAQDITMA
ncbi:unnamed protein product [Polarella glacialis]|uniref:CSD domain-containing protein n=1 Tax=Polarella glacialis TaxID=89957 RepID=A0A813DU02_POLGL|nr:unnamed protein product [Polarella glacialis]